MIVVPGENGVRPRPKCVDVWAGRLTMILPTYDRHPERHREAVLTTLARVEAVRAEARLQAFLAAAGGVGVWEQAFVDYLAERRLGTFLSGANGPDLIFFISPATRDGFWLVEQPGGARGKGWLGGRDVERLLELAREKGLWV